MIRPALMLAAHGDGSGSPANMLVRWHAARLAAGGRFREVVAAFHRGSPSFAEALDEMAARRVIVVPCFASRGYYTEHVLPQALRAGRPATHDALRMAPPLGAHPGVSRLIAQLAGPALTARVGVSGLLVVGHGTRRHAGSGDTAQRASARLSRRLGVPAVAAYLDQDPAIESVAARLPWDHVIVVPYLFGGGEHARSDVADRLGAVLAADRLRFLPPLGRLPGVTTLLEHLARRHASGAPRARTVTGGRVVLVGAGPGDPGLLTRRGRAMLARADVVVHDRLVAAAVLGLARAGAPRIDVGKAPNARQPGGQRRINELLIRHARLGRCVVRLKGGDPFLFGRGGEEVDACRTAGVPCEVVPGVTSAFAVPATAGIPITLRDVARSVAVVTGQSRRGDLAFDARAVAAMDTIVVLMGRRSLRQVCDVLLSAGRDPATPAACIQEGGTTRQRVVTGSLATIATRADLAALRAPAVTVIGAVAARASALTGRPAG